MGFDCDEEVECYLDHINTGGDACASHQIASVRLTSKTPTG